MKIDKVYRSKAGLLHLITFTKVLLLGFLISEIYYFSITFSSRLSEYLVKNNYEMLFLGLAVAYLLLIVVYLLYRRYHEYFSIVLKSGRIDLAIVFLAGIASGLFIKGLGSSWYKTLVSVLSYEQLLVLLFSPFFLLIGFLIYAGGLWINSRRIKNESFFISDNERESKDEDLLDVYEKAERFAERILNQRSPDSLVFGVDAPWGIGKSTFVNFCRNYWSQKSEGYVIVYVFSPLKYENRDNLLEKFIDGLIKSIQKEVFIPEIRPVLSEYSKLIGNIKGKLFGFIDLELPIGSYSVDDAFQDLELILANTNKKVVVIIDDLDRLNLSAIKDLLFTVKKSFTLPNVSYVLCYDTENINSLEQDQPNAEKVTEFLEKFVNVKVSLYLGSKKLSDYVSTNLEKSLSGNSQADPILVSKAIGGLKDIFNSNEYHSYVPFVGDIRKLKRLINIVLLLDLEKTNFENSDINSYDLIHLLLIYINYPNIFRKIYNCETGEKKDSFL